MAELEHFNMDEIEIVNNSIAMAEELVCNYYKISANQWLRHRYDVKTLEDLLPAEIINGPFAQVMRYMGQRKNMSLGSSKYDFYKICIQDNSILSAIRNSQGLQLFSFALYIVAHELIHIVRFGKYLQNFDATDDEKMKEEVLVHEKTNEILSRQNFSGLGNALIFYEKWRKTYIY
jgi:hypothetical protein